MDRPGKAEIIIYPPILTNDQKKLLEFVYLNSRKLLILIRI